MHNYVFSILQLNLIKKFQNKIHKQLKVFIALAKKFPRHYYMFRFMEISFRVEQNTNTKFTLLFIHENI